MNNQNNNQSFNEYIKEENEKTDKDLKNQKEKIIKKYGKEYYDELNKLSSKISNMIFKE